MAIDTGTHVMNVTLGENFSEQLEELEQLVDRLRAAAPDGTTLVVNINISPAVSQS